MILLQQFYSPIFFVVWNCSGHLIFCIFTTNLKSYIILTHRLQKTYIYVFQALFSFLQFLSLFQLHLEVRTKLFEFCIKIGVKQAICMAFKCTSLLAKLQFFFSKILNRSEGFKGEFSFQNLYLHLHAKP